MAVRIRLSRAGAKKRPFYRIVAADTRAPRDGRFIERLGTYNPILPVDHPERVVVKEERIKHWLGVGGTPTNRVARLLSNFGLCEKPTITEQTKKCKPKAKALERMAAKEEALKAAQEAKAQEAAEAQAEAPSEE